MQVYAGPDRSCKGCSGEVKGFSEKETIQLFHHNKSPIQQRKAEAFINTLHAGAPLEGHYVTLDSPT